jgi:protein-tyrosine kinase
MSRIHEALKKAEKERAASAMPQSLEKSLPNDSEIPALSGESALKSGSTKTATKIGARIGSRSQDYLRFEDLKERCQHPQWRPNANQSAFDGAYANTHCAEQFRTLRSRLYQMRSSQSLSRVLVTSAVPTEGKTFVAYNLARAIVRQPDQRALVVDADIRMPRMHTVLGAPSSPGLTDYLRGDASELDIIQHGAEGNLCLIAGGEQADDASELLSNGRLKELLDRLGPVFEWIIIDSPPCLPVADANIIAEHCDGILLVAKAGFTPAETAIRARQELQGRPVVGVVLNAVKGDDRYGMYYSSYGYGYGGNGSERKKNK